MFLHLCKVDPEVILVQAGLIFALRTRKDKRILTVNLPTSSRCTTYSKLWEYLFHILNIIIMFLIRQGTIFMCFGHCSAGMTVLLLYSADCTVAVRSEILNVRNSEKMLN